VAEKPQHPCVGYLASRPHTGFDALIALYIAIGAAIDVRLSVKTCNACRVKRRRNRISQRSCPIVQEEPLDRPVGRIPLPVVADVGDRPASRREVLEADDERVNRRLYDDPHREGSVWLVAGWQPARPARLGQHAIPGVAVAYLAVTTGEVGGAWDRYALSVLTLLTGGAIRVAQAIHASIALLVAALAGGTGIPAETALVVYADRITRAELAVVWTIGNHTERLATIEFLVAVITFKTGSFTTLAEADGGTCLLAVAVQSVVAGRIVDAWQRLTWFGGLVRTDAFHTGVNRAGIAVAAIGVLGAGHFATVSVLVAVLTCFAGGLTLDAPALLGAGLLPVAELAIVAIGVGDAVRAAAGLGS